MFNKIFFNIKDEEEGKGKSSFLKEQIERKEQALAEDMHTENSENPRKAQKRSYEDDDDEDEDEDDDDDMMMGGEKEKRKKSKKKGGHMRGDSASSNKDLLKHDSVDDEISSQINSFMQMHNQSVA